MFCKQYSSCSFLRRTSRFPFPYHPFPALLDSDGQERGGGGIAFTNYTNVPNQSALSSHKRSQIQTIFKKLSKVKCSNQWITKEIQEQEVKNLKHKKEYTDENFSYDCSLA